MAAERPRPEIADCDSDEESPYPDLESVLAETPSPEGRADGSPSRGRSPTRSVMDRLRDTPSPMRRYRRAGGDHFHFPPQSGDTGGARGSSDPAPAHACAAAGYIDPGAVESEFIDSVIGSTSFLNYSTEAPPPPRSPPPEYQAGDFHDQRRHLREVESRYAGRMRGADRRSPVPRIQNMHRAQQLRGEDTGRHYEGAVIGDVAPPPARMVEPIIDRRMHGDDPPEADMQDIRRFERRGVDAFVPDLHHRDRSRSAPLDPAAFAAAQVHPAYTMHPGAHAEDPSPDFAAADRFRARSVSRVPHRDPVGHLRPGVEAPSAGPVPASHLGAAGPVPHREAPARPDSFPPLHSTVDGPRPVPTSQTAPSGGYAVYADLVRHGEEALWEPAHGEPAPVPSSAPDPMEPSPEVPAPGPLLTEGEMDMPERRPTSGMMSDGLLIPSGDRMGAYAHHSDGYIGGHSGGRMSDGVLPGAMDMAGGVSAHEVDRPRPFVRAHGSRTRPAMMGAMDGGMSSGMLPMDGRFGASQGYGLPAGMPRERAASGPMPPRLFARPGGMPGMHGGGGHFMDGMPSSGVPAGFMGPDGYPGYMAPDGMHPGMHPDAMHHGMHPDAMHRGPEAMAPPFAGYPGGMAPGGMAPGGMARSMGGFSAHDPTGQFRGVMSEGTIPDLPRMGDPAGHYGRHPGWHGASGVPAAAPPHAAAPHHPCVPGGHHFPQAHRSHPGDPHAPPAVPAGVEMAGHGWHPSYSSTAPAVPPPGHPSAVGPDAASIYPAGHPLGAAAPGAAGLDPAAAAHPAHPGAAPAVPPAGHLVGAAAPGAAPASAPGMPAVAVAPGFASAPAAVGAGAPAVVAPATAALGPAAGLEGAPAWPPGPAVAPALSVDGPSMPAAHGVALPPAAAPVAAAPVASAPIAAAGVPGSIVPPVAPSGLPHPASGTVHAVPPAAPPGDEASTTPGIAASSVISGVAGAAGALGRMVRDRVWPGAQGGVSAATSTDTSSDAVPSSGVHPAPVPAAASTAAPAAAEEEARAGPADSLPADTTGDDDSLSAPAHGDELMGGADLPDLFADGDLPADPAAPSGFSATSSRADPPSPATPLPHSSSALWPIGEDRRHAAGAVSPMPIETREQGQQTTPDKCIVPKGSRKRKGVPFEKPADFELITVPPRHLSDGNGPPSKRTERHRIRPLEFWRGERVNYVLAPGGNGLMMESVTIARDLPKDIDGRPIIPPADAGSLLEDVSPEALSKGRAGTRAKGRAGRRSTSSTSPPADLFAEPSPLPEAPEAVPIAPVPAPRIAIAKKRAEVCSHCNEPMKPKSTACKRCGISREEAERALPIAVDEDEYVDTVKPDGSAHACKVRMGLNASHWLSCDIRIPPSSFNAAETLPAGRSCIITVLGDAEGGLAFCLNGSRHALHRGDNVCIGEGSSYSLRNNSTRHNADVKMVLMTPVPLPLTAS